MPRVDVKQAAKILGIQPRSVRLRIEEGRLPAQMIDGKWMIDLEEGREVPIPPTSQTRMESLPASGNQQFDLVMQSWIAPLVKEIRELSGENGELRTRLEVAERERMVLSDILEGMDGSKPYPTETQPGFWRWLFGK